MTSCAVVIPCYNDGRYLNCSVSAARSQTHRPVEVVVVDDGSTDPETIAEMERLEPIVDILVRHQNAGPSGARNAGIAVSSSPYLLCLDADDEIEPTYVARACRILDDDPSVGIVYCKADRFDDSGHRWPWKLPPFEIGRMLAGNVIHAGGIFRREDWEAVGGYGSGDLEDYRFWMNIIRRGRSVRYIDDTLYHYRSNPGARRSWLSAERETVAGASILEQNIELYSKYSTEFVRHLGSTSRMLARYERRYGRIDILVDWVAGARRRVRRRVLDFSESVRRAT